MTRTVMLSAGDAEHMSSIITLYRADLKEPSNVIFLVFTALLRGGQWAMLSSSVMSQELDKKSQYVGGSQTGVRGLRREINFPQNKEAGHLGSTK